MFTKTIKLSYLCRLIECDRVLATDYYAKYADKDVQESRFIRKSLDTIGQFKQMMAEYRMPFWMSSGTLLGWYRQWSASPDKTRPSISLRIQNV